MVPQEVQVPRMAEEGCLTYVINAQSFNNISAHVPYHGY